MPTLNRCNHRPHLLKNSCKHLAKQTQTPITATRPRVGCTPERGRDRGELREGTRHSAKGARRRSIAVRDSRRGRRAVIPRHLALSSDSD
jgi:hypothetical protein